MPLEIDGFKKNICIVDIIVIGSFHKELRLRWCTRRSIVIQNQTNYEKDHSMKNMFYCIASQSKEL